MPMTPTERKVELLKRDTTMTALAESLGCTVSHVSHVIHGRRRAPRIEQAIADAIGKPVKRVFEPVAA